MLSNRASVIRPAAGAAFALSGREISMGVRRPRRAVIVCAAPRSEERARRLERELIGLGVEARYLGVSDDARRIARLVADERSDAVEICLPAGASGVRLCRQLLRELIEIGLGGVSIVLHRGK
jgi:methylmalonyl-CoA mutase cobalamin-binding subunit